MNKRLILMSAALILIFTYATRTEVKDFKLADLEGDWEGVGTFVVPMTGIDMDIEGKANFKYVDDKKYLRTELTGEKFLFTYSDSGHLALDSKSNAVTWEVWDNLGRYAKYHGKKEGGSIRGERQYKGKLYSVEINLVTTDSITFRLTTADDEERVDKARFYLWRTR